MDLVTAEKQIDDMASEEYRRRCHCIPSMLYHYTDAQGLEGIIRTGEIWVTQVMYLNDPHELTHGLMLFREVLRDEKRKPQVEQRKHFIEMCEDQMTGIAGIHMDSELKWHQYCACLSAVPDDLSQYRAYSARGTGYCIGFDSAELRKNIGQISNGGRFGLVEMEYVEAVQREMFRNIIDTSAKVFAEMLAGNAQGLSKQTSRPVIQRLLNAIGVVVNLMKQPGFAAEREWRIMLNPQGGLMSTLVEDLLFTTIRNNVFVPRLRLRVTDTDRIHNALREIYVGPCLQFEKARNGLLKLLLLSKTEENGVIVEIKRSSTYLE